MVPSQQEDPKAECRRPNQDFEFKHDERVVLADAVPASGRALPESVAERNEALGARQFLESPNPRGNPATIDTLEVARPASISEGSVAERIAPPNFEERAPEEERTAQSKHFANSEEWFTAADIARACGTNKKRVHRVALRDGWPARDYQNRREYQPPARIARVIVGKPGKEESGNRGVGDTERVRFADLAHSDEQRKNVLLREKAVLLLENSLNLGKEMALKLTVQKFHVDHLGFSISVSSLRRWQAAYRMLGLDGLVEQKRGKSGRKGFVFDLSSEDQLALTAGAVGYGIKGRLNVARAYQDLVANPTIEGVLADGQPKGRPTWLHGDHESKSYVPPSVRAKVRELAPPGTVKLMQIGPKAQKLSGAFTPCSYDNLKCGQAFTADDMTANVYVWCEWPNEKGFLLLRPQILATMDVGSLAWLNARVIIRPKGQYNKDDVWGLIGDLFDAHGLFETAILEGGIWQSGVVRGTRTGISDEERFGGLASLGVKLIHTRTPRGKIIEGEFNKLQHAADNCRGYCGRMEMKDCPEAIKKQLALCDKGHAHPREFFMHLDEYCKHVAAVMQKLNNERNDGKILRGSSPWEKWGIEKPEMRVIPESHKWMYRAAYSIGKVTANGVKVTQGTGRNQLVYYYDNPAVLETWRGQRVVVFWNDSNPDTDACVYTLRAGRQDKFLCVAKRVQSPDRLGTSGEAFAAEATRKKLHSQLAVSKSLPLMPYYERTVSKVAVSESRGFGVSERLQAAKAEAEEKVASQARTAKAVRSVEVSEDDMAAATEDRSAGVSECRSITAEDLADLI